MLMTAKPWLGWVRCWRYWKCSYFFYMFLFFACIDRRIIGYGPTPNVNRIVKMNIQTQTRTPTVPSERFNEYSVLIYIGIDSGEGGYVTISLIWLTAWLSQLSIFWTFELPNFLGLTTVSASKWRRLRKSWGTWTPTSVWRFAGLWKRWLGMMPGADGDGWWGWTTVVKNGQAMANDGLMMVFW